MGFLSKAKQLKEKADKIYDRGKLEKARIVVYTKSGDSYIVDKSGDIPDKIDVQFNPSEYSIQRKAIMSNKSKLGSNFYPDDYQIIGGEPAILSLDLYFDSYTELLSEQGAASFVTSKASDLKDGAYSKLESKVSFLPNADMNEEYSPNPDYKVNQLCDTLLSLVKIDHEEHDLRLIGFVWGEHLHFIGRVFSYTVQYTVFDRNGTPVRAKISLQIIGEEAEFLIDAKQFPKESPDRTKQRTLRYGEQLWMMAQAEYGDTAHWKTIAEANGILNPRKSSGVMRLKVPSIR